MTPESLAAELRADVAGLLKLVEDHRQSSREAAAAYRALEAERDALLAARTSPVHGWTDADADAARLALELECLLTDRDMPMAVTSRWWESAHEALALHRKRLSEEQAALLPPGMSPKSVSGTPEPTPRPAPAMGREAFEAWATDYSTIPLERDDDDRLSTGYTVIEQTMLWDAWQAAMAHAREAMESVPVPRTWDFATSRHSWVTSQDFGDYRAAVLRALGEP